MDIRGELFSEKNVTEVIRTFESVFPRPLTAKWLSVLAGAVVGVAGWGCYHSGLSDANLDKFLQGIVGFALLFSSSLFGVVIAGFAIFSASLKPAILKRLAESKYPGSKISNLAFIFSMFTYVLVTLFMVFVSAGVFYGLVSVNSIFVEQVILSKLNYAPVATLVLYSFLSFFIAQIVFNFSIMFSFIWNLHQVLLVIAGAELAEIYDGEQ